MQMYFKNYSTYLVWLTRYDSLTKKKVRRLETDLCHFKAI